VSLWRRGKWLVMRGRSVGGRCSMSGVKTGGKVTEEVWIRRRYRRSEAELKTGGSRTELASVASLCEGWWSSNVEKIECGDVICHQR
jgi:hypothetical protein